MISFARSICVAALTVACTPTPMTPERAERECRRQVNEADGVFGQVGVGVGTGGTRAGGNITVTNRVLNPQTPEEFMADCTSRKLERRPEPTTFGISVGTG